MRKKDTPFLDEKEVDDLYKEAIEKKKPIRKGIEKAIPLEMEKPKLKPVSKQTKKLQEKIVRDIKTIEPIKELPIIPPEKSIDIEYTINEVVKYDLNWYFVKERFISFKKRLLTPYTLYANWFNKKFNSKKESGMDNLDSLEGLFESIKEDTKNIDVNKIMNENKPDLPKIDDKLSIELERLFEEIKPEIIKVIYENVKRQNEIRIREQFLEDKI